VAAPANPTVQDLVALFDAPAPLTLGVEEELMLLDPETLDLAPRAPELLERTGGDDRFKLEMPAAQIEIMSPPLSGAAEAEAFLATARRDLAAAGDGLVRLAGAGVHPFASGEGELNPGERYERTLSQFGRIARRQLVFGLQVHVAVRGAERALAVYNRLRNRLPELLALAANAPYYEGEDTGLATVRPKLCELLPRQGVPPAFGSWGQFAAALAWGERAAAVPEPRVWWWELRPHAVWGTLELRVPDTQATVADSAAIAAVIHALAANLARRHDEGERETPVESWRIEENRARALARGPDAELADLVTGEPVSARERLAALLDDLEPDAAAQGASEQLGRARALVDGGGAVRQREAGGAHAAARWLSESFLR
jgi:glutamate---cysteine ligase / carboxylate-amine ligase